MQSNSLGRRAASNLWLVDSVGPPPTPVNVFLRMHETHQEIAIRLFRIQCAIFRDAVRGMWG